MRKLFFALAATWLIIAWLLFFKWFLAPIALGLFIASILLYLSKSYKISKSFILVMYTLLLGSIWLGVWWGWSEVRTSVEEVVRTTQVSLEFISEVIQRRTAIPIQFDSQSVLSQVNSLTASISFGAIWSSLGWFVLDLILVVVYSYLFVVYERRIVKTLCVLSDNASRRREIGIKKNSQYIGSLFKIAGILALLYALVLWWVGSQYVILIAVAAALCTLVPTVGTAIWILWATIATYALTQSVTNALVVFLVFEAIQLLEEYLILPAVAWKKLEMNPLATIILIVLGGVIRGIIWIFLALPVASIIQSLLQEKKENHRFLALTQR